MTAVPQDTRNAVYQRAGWSCEICGSHLRSLNIHHRSPRRMGGTRRVQIHYPSNLLVACGSGTTGCHGLIESRRTDSYRFGWLVKTGYPPEEVPFCDTRGNWWLLTDDGRKLPIRLPET